MLSEAGEKWARELEDRDDYPHDITVVDEAEFWLRAFCAEVERRADWLRSHYTIEERSVIGTCSNLTLDDHIRMLAFIELKRELILET